MQTMHLSRQSDKMRSIADYIFIAGLHDDPKLRTRESCLVDPPLPPITEIGILNKAEQDTPPHGFSIIDRSINGHQANLNYNTSKSPLFLCVKRGWDMPPLIDIGVLYEHKEKIMEECKQITETFSGSCANVSNSTKNKIFLTYRRAPPTDCVDILSVYDICVILPDKNEKTPPSYMRIEKSLNKSLLSSGSFICYKKSVCKQYTLSYKPEVLDVFPKCEIVESEAYFCLPKGGLLEVWPSTNSSDPRSVFSTFVLTSSSGVNTYGAVLSFYEPFSYDKLTDSESSELSANPNSRIKVSKAICIVSKWPFFDEFHKFLQHVYRQKNIERHISHFLFEIPFPSVQRPRIQIEFGMETVIFTQPDELPIPICGGRYVQLLKTLGPEFAVQLLYYILLEHKIVLHSLRSHILTNIAETCRSIIFPFNWSFPYIPLCPLNLLDVTESPSAIIVGWDSCFVSRSNLPRDATCIDLDTQKISVAEHRKDVQYKSMPKKATKELKNTLTKKLTEISNYINSDNNAFDAAYKMKEKQIEVSIQEAFLRFMVCLLSGYSEYLIPITTGPCMSSTDVSDRFDVAGFLKSRDRSSRTFYEQLMNTQCFAHFIQERSFVSDKDTCYVFFDECIERVKDEHANLLECENRLQDTTSIITPVECEYVASMKDYVFPSAFDHSLFNSNNGQEVTSSRAQSEEQLSTPSYPVACRRKHEVKSALKLANESKNVKDKPHLWAQFLLSNCYSLWFTHLPYYVSSLPENERDACLRMAFNYLVDMQSANLAQPDELCYRVLMHLCKADMADLSLKILYEMKLSKVKPNAITYGYYNKSVLESSSKGLTNHVVKRWRSAIYRQIIVNVFISITKYKVNDEFLSLRKQLDETRISPGCSSDEEEKSLDKKDILPCESMQSNIDKSSDMSDRGYDSLSRDDAKSMVEQYTDQAPSKRLFASEIKETNEDMLVCEDSILVDICSDTSSSKLASTTTIISTTTILTPPLTQTPLSSPKPSLIYPSL